MSWGPLLLSLTSLQYINFRLAMARIDLQHLSSITSWFVAGLGTSGRERVAMRFRFKNLFLKGRKVFLVAASSSLFGTGAVT